MIIIFFSLIILPRTGYCQVEEAQKMLNDGIIQEIVHGNLDRAMDLYQDLLYKFSKHRRIAAQALIRLAGCSWKLDKLGDARKYYERVVQEYPDIVDSVLIAESRLQALAWYIPSDPLTVLYPNGGELLEAMNDEPVSWTGGTLRGNVRIELIKDGVSHSIIDPDTDNDGDYLWVVPVPSHEAKYNYRIRITDLSNPTIWDESDSTFTIASLKVTVPREGDVFRIWDNIGITWIRSYSMNTAKIELLKAGTVCGAIVNNIKNTGHYVWTVPSDCLPGDDYQIKVTDVTLGSSSISDGYFTITP